jgi:hypothetical protein
VSNSIGGETIPIPHDLWPAQMLVLKGVEFGGTPGFVISSGAAVRVGSQVGPAGYVLYWRLNGLRVKCEATVRKYWLTTCER